MQGFRKLIALTLLCVPLAASQVLQEAVTSDVTITIKHGKDGTIHVQDQDGRGLLFYRGLDEVREYLNDQQVDDWERPLKIALAEQLRADPALKAVINEGFTYQREAAVKK